MTKLQMEQYKIDQFVRLIIFLFGLAAATLLALNNSPHTTAAFTFMGGLLSGGALQIRVRSS